MRTRKEVAAFGVVAIPEPEKEQFQAIYDSLEAHGLNPGSKQEWENGRMGNKLLALTVAANDSYMPQKQEISDYSVNSRTPETLWEIIKPLMAEKVGIPAYETWLAPIQAIEYQQRRLIVATANEFNRNQVLKRFRGELETLLSKLTDGAITGLDVIVDESLTPVILPSNEPEALPIPVIDRRNGYGMRQNPTGNPDIEALLKKHGDMRLVFKESRLFDIPFKCSEKGGWDFDFPALMALGKKFGLERVVWGVLYVMQEVKRDRSITNPAGVLTSAVRRGCKPDSMQALKAYL